MSLFGEAGGQETVPVRFVYNNSLFFRVENRNYTVFENTTLEVKFSLNDLLGEFVEVMLPSLNAFDNRINNFKVKMVQKDGSELEIENDLKLKKMINLGAVGFLGAWVTNETDNYANNTIIILRCHPKNEKFYICQKQPETSIPEPVMINQAVIFGLDLILLDYTTLTGRNRSNYLKVLKLKNEEDLGGPGPLKKLL